ncbi:MAG: transcription repressor NadR [bacterium]
MNSTNSNKRRELVLEELKSRDTAISAGSLGKKFSVSRQVIVNDVAILRASGENIIALPRGYIIQKDNPVNNYVIACKHDKYELSEELYTIVDCGCGIIDVIIEHDIYGQISANLSLYSRKDVREFLNKLKNSDTQPLCNLTNNYHFHTLDCPTPKHFEEVKIALKQKKLLCL